MLNDVMIDEMKFVVRRCKAIKEKEGEQKFREYRF